VENNKKEHTMSKKHQNTNKPETLTITETAQVLGVDNKTVRKFVEMGELGYLGQRINRESVNGFVRRNLLGK
jgi:excisionase family DNA binding protein